MKLRILAALALALLLGGTALAEDGAPAVTLEFESAPVREVIAAIAKTAEANVIVPEDVNGTITNVSLHDVPWRAALEQVAALVGCEVTEEAHGILRVRKKRAAERVVRVYDVRDLAERARPDSDYLPVIIAPDDPGDLEVELDGDRHVLVVRATPERQAAFAKALDRLRASARERNAPTETKPAETDAEGRFHLEGIRVEYATGKAELEALAEQRAAMRARKEQAMQAKLAAELAVLRAELSALRAELAEIKRILLADER